MKTETDIAEKLIRERELYNQHKDRFNRILEEHKSSCERFLEFLDYLGKQEKSINICFHNKITDLKQAIKLYNEAGI